MATVSSLIVNLTARTAAFEKGIKRSLKTFSNFKNSCLSLVTGVNGILAGIGAGVSFAGLSYMVKQSMEAIDTIGKLSDTFGVSTETLSAWEYSAKLAGASIGDVTAGIRNLEKNIANNVGKKDDVFSSLGLSAEALQGMSPEEAFYKVAEGISKIENAAQRTKLTMEIFGKSGTTLLPFIMQGEKGIKEMAAEAEKMGLTFSRLDASKIEIANDSFSRIKESIAGIVNQLSIQVAPYLVYITDQVLGLGDSFGGANEKAQFFQTTISNIAAGVIRIASIGKTVFYALSSWLNYFWGGLTKGVSFFLKALQWAQDGIAKLRGKESEKTFEPWIKIAEESSKELLKDSSNSFDKMKENFSTAFSGEDIGDKIFEKVNENIQKHLPASTPTIGASPAIETPSTAKEKKAEALAYNSKLIDIAAMSKNQTEDPQTKELKKLNLTNIKMSNSLDMLNKILQNNMIG